MIAHAALFPIAVLVFLALLSTAGVVFLRRARQIAGGDDIEALLKRLASVDRDKIAQIAVDLNGPEWPVGTHPEAQPELESWQVWELIGGMEGMEALAANCEVLIDLACHVQQWYPEALPVAEQLRLSAREIQWHLERLQGAERRGNLQAAFPDYAQRAVATYYGMTRHVLALYEASDVAGLQALQAAL